MVYLEAAILLSICAILFLVASPLAGEKAISVQMIASVFGVAGTVVFAKTWIDRQSTEITATTHRLVSKKGWWRVQTVESLYPWASTLA